ncbi:MAG: hypothetical protein EP329_04855 [Deltaproteobacteria bacterium]|nr:MAG: hypothetical protein EP329_04855 [Deltaproteobacteria bacterium]
MSTHTKLGRRSFLGVGAAVVAGAGLTSLVARGTRGASARFSQLEGFPDCPVEVTATLPGVPDGARGQARLYIATPRETLAYELGEVRVRDGRATVEAALTYPYEERVPGRYGYLVEVEVAGTRALTPEAAGYGVRDIRWFG